MRDNHNAEPGGSVWQRLSRYAHAQPIDRYNGLDWMTRFVLEPPWEYDQSICIDASSVARYIAEDDLRSHVNLKEIMPPIAAPALFPWIEFDNPFGCELDWFPSRENDYLPNGRQDRRYAVSLSFLDNGELPERYRESARWAVRLELFVDRDEWPHAWPHSTAWIYLDERGRFLDESPMDYEQSPLWPGHPDAAMYPLIWRIFEMPIYALALMSCRNVSLEDAPVPPRHIRRRMQHDNEPIARFKTLVIDPSRVIRPNLLAGPSSNDKRIRPFHIARGHFVTYTDERKLFGKYSGTFWKPAHVRGTLDEGEVIKDYRVKGPKAA